jgi:MFS transporter, DHA1 family, tetracycline resistance protein
LKGRAALVFIFVTVVLDVVAIGIVIPVLPGLVVDFLGGDTAGAARVTGLFGTIWALMQFVCAPALGALSDRFGRRPVILLSVFGLGLDYILMALAPSLTWLFIGRVFSGITGASFVTAYAYIADISPPEKRAANFGLVGAAWGLGFVLGPALGGILGGISPRLPFWVAAALALVNTLYGLFVLPESLPRERRQSFAWSRANPVGALRLLSSHPELLGLAGVSFLYFLAHQVLPSVTVLYTNYRYGWSEQTMGFTLAGVGIASIIVQAGLVRPVVKNLGERRALMIGLLCGAGAFAVYGMATTGMGFWMGMPIGALMGLFQPSAQGLMTRHVSASEQGQLQGANSSVMGITGLLGPGLFSLTFAHFIGSQTAWHLPGAPYMLAATLLVLATFIAWRITSAHAPIGGTVAVEAAATSD